MLEFPFLQSEPPVFLFQCLRLKTNQEWPFTLSTSLSALANVQRKTDARSPTSSILHSAGA